MIKAAVFTAMLALSLPVAAHNVLGGVYAIGSEIEGEAGFSNGEMAKQGTLVEVFDPAGNLLGTTEIGEEGFFVFNAQRRVDHLFRIDMSAGHLLEVTLPASELPESLAGGSKVAATAQSSSQSSASTVDVADQQALQAMIEKAVAKQVVPLRKELAEFKEKAGLQQILGGMGYIFGLCGLAIWLRQRYQKDDH